MRVMLALVAAGAAAGCVSATKPLVSDFNGSSVKLQTDMFTAKPAETTLAEASRICGKVGKKAEYASSRALPDYNYEHLYLCL